MSIWEMLEPWEVRHDRELRELKSNAEFSEQYLEAARVELLETRRRVDRLELLLEGLVMLLENQGTVDRDTLKLIIRELDRADGKEDGKMGRPPE
ncbi:MAG: hypothetical protein KC636_12270 [Myxococcales bacterium]|nr:hypothetical protein [Myxococcales bacterium]